MTKTIDYIEKEIENSKKFLDRAIRYNLTICVKTETEKLEILEQIKAELEAWEEMKKYIIITEGHNVYFDSTYEYIELKNDCIDGSNSEEESISIISIKKALEVEDE